MRGHRPQAVEDAAQIGRVLLGAFAGTRKLDADRPHLVLEVVQPARRPFRRLHRVPPLPQFISPCAAFPFAGTIETPVSPPERIATAGFVALLAGLAAF